MSSICPEWWGKYVQVNSVCESALENWASVEAFTLASSIAICVVGMLVSRTCVLGFELFSYSDQDEARERERGPFAFQRVPVNNAYYTYLETIRGRRDAQCSEERAVPAVDGRGECVRLGIDRLQVAQDGVHISSSRGESGAGSGEEEDEGGQGPVDHLEGYTRARAQQTL